MDDDNLEEISQQSQQWLWKHNFSSKFQLVLSLPDS